MARPTPETNEHGEKRLGGSVWGKQTSNGDWQYSIRSELSVGINRVLGADVEFSSAIDQAIEKDSLLTNVAISTANHELESKWASSYSSWVSPKTGDFLKNQLEIDAESLSDRQCKRLKWDVPRFEFLAWDIVSQKEASDGRKAIAKAVKTVDEVIKVLGGIKRYPGRLRYNQGEVSAEELAFRLRKVLVVREYDFLKLLPPEQPSKENRATRQLCRVAASFFIRWYKDGRSEEQRGLTVPANWRDIVPYTVTDGRPGCRWLEFLEAATDVLSLKEGDEWDFSWRSAWEKHHKSFRDQSDESWGSEIV